MAAHLPSTILGLAGQRRRSVPWAARSRARPTAALRLDRFVSCTRRTGLGKRSLTCRGQLCTAAPYQSLQSAPQKGRSRRRCTFRVRPSRPQFNGRARSVGVRRPAIVRWHTTPGARRRRSRNDALKEGRFLRGVAPRRLSNREHLSGIPHSRYSRGARLGRAGYRGAAVGEDEERWPRVRARHRRLRRGSRRRRARAAAGCDALGVGDAAGVHAAESTAC